MKIKKILSVILAIIMLTSSLTVLTSCNNEENKDNLGTPDEASLEYVDYGAEILGDFNTGDSNPTINVTLKNTKASSNLNTEMVVFSGAFENLKVTEVIGKDEKITIKTEGTPVAAYSCPGIVTLSAKATDSGKDIDAYTDVNVLSIYADTSSCKLDGKNLSFDVITNDEFVKSPDELNKLMSLDGYEIKVKSVSDDKTAAKLELALKGTKDSDFKELSGRYISVKGDAFKSGKEKSVLINTEPAGICAYVDYLDESGKGAAYLSCTNGSFSNLTKSDISITGGEISDIKDDNGTYELTFNTSAVKDVNDFETEITVSADKLTNLWGTQRSADKVTNRLTYTPVKAKGETFDTIKNFVESNSELFGKVKDAGSGIYSFLKFIGVIEDPTSEKLNEIIDSIKGVQDSVDKLDQKITDMGIQLNQKLDDVLLKSDYNNASSNWLSFVNAYLLPITNDIDRFEKEYNSAGYDFVVNSEDNTFTIYIDENSNVCYPHSVTAKKMYSAFDNALINKTKEIKMTLGLPKAEKAMRDNGGYFDNVVFDAIVDELHESYGADKEMCKNALIFELSYKAIDETGLNTILTDYKNYCNAVAGKTAGLPKTILVASPVDSFNSMASIYYNFYTEAQDDLEGTMNYLLCVLLRGSSLSSIAQSYNTGAKADENDSVNSLYSLASKEILKDGIHHKDKDDGSKWSYVAGRYIKSRSFEPYIYIHYSGKEQYSKQGGWEAFSKSSGHVNSNQLDKIIKKASIISKDKSFKDYLSNLGFDVSGDIVCDMSGVENAGANEHKLRCQVDWGTRYYFSKGNWYAVGTHKGDKNKHKYEAKYYVGHKRLVGTVYSFDGGNYYEDMIEAAWYHEMHALWSNSERAGFVLRNQNDAKWEYGCDDRATFTFFEYA